MTHELKHWLERESKSLIVATMHRAPNMLPDVEDLSAFWALLVENVDGSREEQLSSLQAWALTSIGHDARAASDWLTLLRVLKEEVGSALEARFLPTEALHYWRQLDDFLTYALIEASQLASDMDRATLLEHMVELRQQMERFEASKSDFVTVAAHELKTPLTILEGYANMLRLETEPGSRLRLYSDGMENGIRRTQEIINDLIEVSMIDSRSFELNYQQFYLEKVILIVADNQDKYFHERHVELVVMPLGEELRIYGDPEKLSKAFTKIILNALKYTPDGGHVTVTSSVRREEEADEAIAGYVEVQVSDTGIGIDPANLDRIFQKFTSASDSSLHSSSKTKFKGGGPGLGLPIAKGIVEAHGGRIWAESPGYDEETCPGATFHIELPIWQKRPDEKL